MARPTGEESAAVDFALTKACRCLAARRMARELTRLYDAKLRPHGLRATQFSILAALALKGATPISRLAEVLGLERTTLTRSATLLARKGWVSSPPSTDARERRLQLTEEGRAKLTEAFPAWKEAQELASEYAEASP